tara:strand:- start:408 stop:653 length:246 start_codon:yes stop_codon:yes gene_type:complete
MVWIWLMSLGWGGDGACLVKTWYAEGFETQELEWVVADRKLYSVWDAQTRWNLWGGDVTRTPAARDWEEAVRGCGYQLSWE